MFTLNFDWKAHFLLLCALFALVPAARAKDLEFEKQVRSSAEKIIKKRKLPFSDLGLAISYIENSEAHLLFDLNSERSFLPASLTKIASAAAFLEKFPRGHVFKTQLLTNGTIKEGKLEGDLILKGGGDPAFVSENMWFLVNEFLRSEVQVVSGNIVVDSSRFDEEKFDAGRESVRVQRAYDAPIGAMSFNWNSANVFVRPSQVGSLARVFVDPENTYIEVVNRTKTSKSGGRESIQVRREIISSKKLESGKSRPLERFIVEGEIPLNMRERVLYVNITQPGLWSGHHLRSFLKQRGVSVLGEVLEGKANGDSRVVANSDSKPIAQLLEPMMKFSSNFATEMLTKNLSLDSENQYGQGSLAKTGPGTMAGGLDVIRKYLVEIGLDANHFSLTNTAGLTRENRFRPRDLLSVMLHIRNHFSLFPEFLVALPIAGLDGTLKRRLRELGPEVMVRAKTGLLNDVTGLGGFAGRKDGKLVGFIFLYNGDHRERARDCFDDLIQMLVE